MIKLITSIIRSATKFAVLFFFILNSPSLFSATNKFTLTQSSSYYVTPDTWPVAPKGGDTIFVASDRTKALRFQLLNGEPGNPIVVINTGGQVNIDSPNAWGAITFENCKHIKITGNGHLNYKYGFVLSAANCGLAFSELSSDCEASFIKISHDGFFGIFAKKDYNGKPPTPAPVFSNLVIHDCFIENVTEGMYLGETKSPGMEFKHVKIYNNIVRNTKRESIQIANMVENVEIYNNTLLNAGQANEEYQNNILQIGDNSVAAVYNNILVGAPKCGIITMGRGNNSFENNYISSCKGIFVDNRLFTDGDAPVTIAGNYFHNNSPTEIIKNMNELNPLTIAENVWNTELPFYNNASGNSGNFTLINNRKTMVRQVVFIDPDNGNYALAEGNDIKYSSIGAPGGPEILGVTKSAESPAVPESKQIILDKSMLTDEVSGGSYWSPDYLVDEQTLSPEIGQHPVSQSWKPYWNMTKGPYHAIIDLKADYNITAIHLHDMHNTQNLEVSAGSPGNWQPLFTEPCDKFNVWKTH